jgi:hypothetical protein
MKSKSLRRRWRQGTAHLVHRLSYRDWLRLQVFVGGVPAELHEACRVVMARKGMPGVAA